MPPDGSRAEEALSRISREILPGSIREGHTSHHPRHTPSARPEGRGVASDATFRAWREDGTVRDGGPSTTGRRSPRRSEPAGQGGRDRTVLCQMRRCCIHSGCIKCKYDAAKGTKKTQRRGQMPIPAGRQANQFSMAGKPLYTSSQSGHLTQMISRNTRPPGRFCGRPVP
jgi:hypothetical protein